MVLVRLTQTIALVVLVPLLAMTAFAGLAVAMAVTDGQRAARLSTLVGLGQRCAALARALQDERAAAVARMVGPGPALTERSATYLRAVGGTDAAIAALRSAAAGIPAPEPAASRLSTLESQLGLLDSVRGQTSGSASAASGVAFRYRVIVTSTVDFRDVVSQAGQAPPDVAEAIRATVELSRAAEALGLQQVAVLLALDAGRLSPSAAADVTASGTAFTEAVTTFMVVAPADWRAWWAPASTGPDVLAAQALQDAVAQVAPGEPVGVDATVWVAAMGTRIGLVHDVEARADAGVLALVERLRAGAIRRAAAEVAAVLAAASVALGLAFRLGRPVIVDLRRLRDVARAVAYQQLPELMARLSQPLGWRDVNPEAALAGLPTTGVTGRHEVAEVAAAFDDVYRAAVRSTAELARSRLGVAQMHVSLARRLQRRTVLITARLDAAERHEREVTRLEFLFGLDHLVTLMGRTTDALLVLGGHRPGSVRPRPVPMLDVLRAATGRIQDYARIVIAEPDPYLAVAGRVVDELVLLLAELMDNATVLSQQPVAVQTQRLADRVVVQIIDHGIGMDERRRRLLNERLAAPVVDVDAVSRMGLTVVGLLAANHGLRVDLRPNLPVGTVAEVIIPAALLCAPVPGISDVDAPGAPEQAVPRRGAINGVPRQPKQPDTETAELPIFASRRPVRGLPVRSPRAYEFPERQEEHGRPARRDPRRVAAALSAYAQGIRAARANTDHRGPTTRESE
jgi:signal transduction histidine kinase